MTHQPWPQYDCLHRRLLPQVADLPREWLMHSLEGVVVADLKPAEVRKLGEKAFELRIERGEFDIPMAR